MCNWVLKLSEKGWGFILPFKGNKMSLFYVNIYARRMDLVYACSVKCDCFCLPIFLFSGEQEFYSQISLLIWMIFMYVFACQYFSWFFFCKLKYCTSNTFSQKVGAKNTSGNLDLSWCRVMLM